MNESTQVLAGIVAFSSAFGDCKMCKPDPPPPPPAVYGCESGYVCDVDAPIVVRTVVSTGTSVRFTAAGAILHVLEGGREIASGAEAVDASPATGAVEVLVRSAGPATTTTLYQDGASLGGAFSIGAWHPVLWPLAKSDVLEGIRLPNGAGPELSLMIMKDDGTSLDRLVHGGGTRGGARAQDLPAATRVVALVVMNGNTAGRARLVRNDRATRDEDGDGLGDRLEAVLGTCSQLTGTAQGPDGVAFDCKLAADARDTDGDGLADAAEVLGQGGEPLALYGADARHKDMFVEVDYQRRSPTEAARKMRPDVARKFADYYANRVGLPAQDAARLVRNAASLRNPDGKPGISVHQDIGVPPERPEDATIYGDWGGYTATDPVSDGKGGYLGMPVGDAWRQHMTAARRGLFRYSLPYSSGGGSTGVGISWQFGVDDAWGLAHESGHANGLGHGGPLELPEPNCKPNYQSMMNYAYQSVPAMIGFSDGEGAGAIDNTSLVEQQAVDPAEDFYLDLLESTYKYGVDRAMGHVDWDRDGVFSSSPVRAYANYKPGGGGCEYTRVSGHAVTPDKTRTPPAIARSAGRLYVLWAYGAGEVRYRSSTSTFACPGLTASCGSWDEQGSFSGDASGGVDAARLGDLLHVVYRGGDGTLRMRTISSSRAVSAPTVIATGVSGEPAIASHGCELALAYKIGTSVRLRRMTCGGAFSAEEQVTSVIGSESSPALVYAYLPPFDDEPRLYAWLTSATHDNELWRFDGGPWTKLSLFDAGSRSYGRPALASVGKKLYAAYPIAVADEQQRIVEWQQSYVKPSGEKRIGLKGPFDNVWAYGRGMDFLYDEGVDTNLRAVANWIRPPTSEANDSVWFLPKADAINAYVMQNFDDWLHLGVGICRGVVNPGGLVANPVKCRDWPKL